MIKKLIYIFIVTVAAAVFSLTITGCSNTWQGLKKDTKKAGKSVEKTYKKTKKKIVD